MQNKTHTHTHAKQNISFHFALVLVQNKLILPRPCTLKRLPIDATDRHGLYKVVEFHPFKDNAF